MRVSVPRYHETILSLLKPGNVPSSQAFQPAVLEMERLMGWSLEQRQHILLRSDGGCGTDANINWQLARHYQLLTKGFSGQRAQAYGQTVQAWQELRPGLCVAPVPHPIRYARRTQSFLRRWQDSHAQWKYAIQIHTLLTTSPAAVVQRYDARGAMESEFKDDKSGWHLARRRKHQWCAQEALLLLTDLAHNTLAYLRPWLFTDSPFMAWGPLRVIRDLLAMPGQVRFKGDKLVMVALPQRHPYASDMAHCLTELLAKCDLPAS